MVLESVPTASRNDPGFQAFVPKAVRLANAIRQRFENGDCQFTLSTRTVLRWAAGVLMFEGSARRTHMSAALYSLNATFADGLDAEDRTILFEAYQLVFGENASQFARAIAKLGRNQYNAASRAGGGMPEDP